MNERRNQPPRSNEFIFNPKPANTDSITNTSHAMNKGNPDLSRLSGATISPEDQRRLKFIAAQKALDFIKPNMVLGIGTGTTVNELIPLLARISQDIDGVVSSSSYTTDLLLENGITPYPLDSIQRIHLYIDGADQINPRFEMIKGGGGALTGEKIITRMSEHFICIAGTNKLVKEFTSAIPIEVIPLSLPLVEKELEAMGAIPYLRKDYKTEYGNYIIDVRGLDTRDPASLESDLNNIEGVVTNGIFARRPADTLILGTYKGVLEYKRLGQPAISLALDEA